MGQEIELKFHIEDAAQLEAVRHFPEFSALAEGKEELLSMETTYYDTPDGDFAARKWTFRRRAENGVCITCLKTPGTKDGDIAVRGEWETTETDLEKAIGALVVSGAPLDLGRLAAFGLSAVCSARFVRRAQLLRLPDGSTCERACDAGELCGGGLTEPFFEVELELKSGEPAQMLSLCERLQAACKLRREPRSKVQRALALRDAATVPPDEDAPVPGQLEL